MTMCLLNLRMYPLNAERLYTYLGTLAGLVESQAKGSSNNGQGQSSSFKCDSFDDFKRLGPPYFSGSSNLTEAEDYKNRKFL